MIETGAQDHDGLSPGRQGCSVSRDIDTERAS